MHVFDHPVQTIIAVATAYDMDRKTLGYACSTINKRTGTRRLGEAAYKSGDTWLIDTSHPDFQAYVERHARHHLSKTWQE